MAPAPRALQLWISKERGSLSGGCRAQRMHPVLLAHLPLWLLFNPEPFPFRQDDPVRIGTQPLTLSCLAYFPASQNTLCLTPTCHNLDVHFMEQADRKCAMGVTRPHSLGYPNLYFLLFPWPLLSSFPTSFTHGVQENSGRNAQHCSLPIQILVPPKSLLPTPALRGAPCADFYHY